MASRRSREKTPINFLINPSNRSSIWNAHVLIHNWLEGKHKCVDVTGVSSMVGFAGDNVFEVVEATSSSTTKVQRKQTNISLSHFKVHSAPHKIATGNNGLQFHYAFVARLNPTTFVQPFF